MVGRNTCMKKRVEKIRYQGRKYMIRNKEGRKRRGDRKEGRKTG